VVLQAQIWQLNFAVTPEALQEINMAMRVNEDILRWVVVKRGLDKMPNPRTMFHQLSEHAEFLTPPTRQQGGNSAL
jgi:ribosomal protein S6